MHAYEIDVLSKIILDLIHMRDEQNARSYLDNIPPKFGSIFKQTSEKWGLLASAYIYDCAPLIPLMIEKGACADANESRAFRLAAEEGNLAICRCLLDAGARIDELNGYALSCAIKGNHEGVTLFLLERGALPDYETIGNVCKRARLDLLQKMVSNIRHTEGHTPVLVNGALDRALVASVEADQAHLVDWILNENPKLLYSNGHSLNTVLEKRNRKIMDIFLKHGLESTHPRMQNLSNVYPLIGAWVEHQKLYGAMKNIEDAEEVKEISPCILKKKHHTLI